MTRLSSSSADIVPSVPAPHDRCPYAVAADEAKREADHVRVGLELGIERDRNIDEFHGAESRMLA
jgi:hypothetical protein